MGFLISCSSCKHMLTLPEGFIGQPVRCPKCASEFAAYPSAAPAMEVDSPPPPPEPPPVKLEPAPPAKEPAPPLETAYAPRDRMNAAPLNRTFYCILCGENVAANDESCPNCGCPIQSPYEDEYRARGRRQPRDLPPVTGFLPIVGAVLIPVGVVFFIGAPIADEVLRRNPARFIVPAVLVVMGIGVELTALAFCFTWLYQAWRVVLRDDEEVSPGLMVGLLFVPFFNFYWLFRAVPGLSKAIHRETRNLEPRRAGSAGWVPGLIACIFFLIPYGQPIAMCVFLAWMLIANNALQRLIRLNNRYQEEEEAERREEPASRPAADRL